MKVSSHGADSGTKILPASNRGVTACPYRPPSHGRLNLLFFAREQPLQGLVKFSNSLLIASRISVPTSLRPCSAADK